MKNKLDDKKAFTHLVVDQSQKGMFIEIGNGMARASDQEEPFRVIDDCPVFHISKNQLTIDVLPFNFKSIKKLGSFYHPYLMMGMPSVSGNIHFYCDSRDKHFYVLWTRTKIDSDFFGESMSLSDPEIIAWTSKMSGDNIYKAGSRMIRAFFLDYTYTESGVYADQYMKERCENGSPYGSDFIMYCMGSVLLTEHRSQQNFDNALKNCPDFLKTHFIKQATIGNKDMRDRDYFDE